jgi:predicted dehydrogenase
MTTSLWPRATQDLEELPLPTLDEEPRWESFYENVLECIEGKATQIVTHAQIRNNMKVMMAAFESATTNRTVEL